MRDEKVYLKLDKTVNDRINKEIKDKNNQRYIRDFEKKQNLDRKTLATIVTNKQKLVLIMKDYIHKDWLKMDRKDFEKVVAEIDNNPNYSEVTKSNNKKIIKMFDKFLNGGETYSPRTRWIKASPIKRKLNGLKRDDLLTEQEKKALLNACDNKRDIAIISIWLETGLRPKELRTLTVGSVTFDKDLAYIDIEQDTKTGHRTIPIYFSKQALLNYLNEHPARNDKKSPLWINSRKNKIESLNTHGFVYLLEKVTERSGIKKRVYWYLARHSSYTDKVAQGWNEGILKEFHGIDPSSNVLNRYIHLSGKDLKKKVKEYYGLEKGKKTAPDLTIVKCLNCEAENPSNNVRCSKCGYIISPEEMQKELQKKQEKENRQEKEIQELKKQIEAVTKMVEQRLKDVRK